MRKFRQCGRTTGRSGFTLFEVLIVIVILGVLAALVIPQFTNTSEKAKIDLTQQLVKTGLATPLELYKTHCGAYPTTEQGLIVLFEAPNDDSLKGKWAGPYVKEPRFKDAWDRDLNYRAPGQYNERSFDLWSSGPDGIEGNDDDIKNWDDTRR
jgi:general secretion pathway protein G